MADDEPIDLEAYKKALEQEFEAEPEQYATALEILEKFAPRAALEVIVLMQHCPDPRLRLSAAKYLLDNTVFSKPADEENLRKFLSELTAQPPTP